MGKHVGHGSVLFDVGRFGEIDLSEFNAKDVLFEAFHRLVDLVFVVSHGMLVLGTDSNGTRVVDQLLHGVLNEFVKTVELLSYQSLLFKVGTDHGPGVFLTHGQIVVLAVVKDVSFFSFSCFGLHHVFGFFLFLRRLIRVHHVNVGHFDGLRCLDCLVLLVVEGGLAGLCFAFALLCLMSD